MALGWDVRFQPSLTELHHRPAPSVAGLTTQEGLSRQAFRLLRGSDALVMSLTVARR